jgi:putative membrane protein
MWLIPWLALALWVWLAGAPPALAHTGQPPTPQDLWTAWNWSLTLWLGFGLTLRVYVRGWCVLEAHQRRPTIWQTAGFVGALGLAFVALVSPLDAASSALLSAHMVQHVLLILGVAPLLALSKPLGPLLLGRPRSLGQWLGRAWQSAGWLRRAWAALSQPAVAGPLGAVALWGWHIPLAYQAALGNQWVHDAEHLSFLGTALIFWWWVAQPGGRHDDKIAAGFVALFAMGMQSTVLALFITAAPHPWYPAYAASTPAWGLTPLEDQQLAGAIMWVPSAVIYLCAVVGLLAAGLRQMDQRDQQTPQWLSQPAKN